MRPWGCILGHAGWCFILQPAAAWLAAVWQDILRLTRCWEDLWKHVKWLPIRKQKGHIIHWGMTNGKVLLTDELALQKVALCSKGHRLPKPDNGRILEQGLATEATRGSHSSWRVRAKFVLSKRKQPWRSCAVRDLIHRAVTNMLQWSELIHLICPDYQWGSFKRPDSRLHRKHQEV